MRAIYHNHYLRRLKMDKVLKISFKEIRFKVSMAKENSSPDLLARLSLVFIDENERFFTFNGFTIRKSKHDGRPYLTMPSKKSGDGFYKFALIEGSLKKQIETKAVEVYEYEEVPVID